MSRTAALAVLLAAAVLGPAGAEAKPIHSKLKASISGSIDPGGKITYSFSGSVGAQNLSFGCMEGRRVVLFRVEKGGARKRVLSTKSGFFGFFSAPLEKRLAAISGHYFAKVEPRTRITRHGPLRCLTARSKAFLIQVPPALLESGRSGTGS